MNPVVLVNGRADRWIEPNDRGLQYGDGLFETIACRHGRPRHLGLHLQRLARGCERLGLPAPQAALLEPEILQALAGLPATGGEGRAIARLVVTRGPARARGYRPAGNEVPTRVVSAHPWPAPLAGPYRVGLGTLRLALQPALAGIKHLNRLEQVLAQREAAALGLDELLLLDARGDVASGSMGNAWLRLDGEWCTPPIEACGVAGVTRERLLAGAGGAGFRPHVRRLVAADLDRVEAMAFSNVRLGLQAVNWYHGRPLPVDPALAQVRVALDGDE